MLRNSDIAELLAIEAESTKMPAQKALRRASRRAFLWPEEAASLVEQGRALTDLQGVGPYIERMITQWVEKPSEVPAPPEIRRQFFTMTEAQEILTKKPAWLASVH